MESNRRGWKFIHIQVCEVGISVYTLNFVYLDTPPHSQVYAYIAIMTITGEREEKLGRNGELDNVDHYSDLLFLIEITSVIKRFYQYVTDLIIVFFTYSS